jgi:hypothetical protein
MADVVDLDNVEAKDFPPLQNDLILRAARGMHSSGLWPPV